MGGEVGEMASEDSEARGAMRNLMTPLPAAEGTASAVNIQRTTRAVFWSLMPLPSVSRDDEHGASTSPPSRAGGTLGNANAAPTSVNISAGACASGSHSGLAPKRSASARRSSEPAHKLRSARIPKRSTSPSAEVLRRASLSSSPAVGLCAPHSAVTSTSMAPAAAAR